MGFNPRKTGPLGYLDTMPILKQGTWYQASYMASDAVGTPYHAIKKPCLAMQNAYLNLPDAKSQKPAIKRASGHFC